ncbi:MAG: glycosyltransferase [Bacteroidales bacterium]|nr:glycosyltransferase [Bacteroidales bacterium]
MPSYSVAIRTLGTACAFYQRTLDSIVRQTLQPEAIVVYIAEGYALPRETVGREKYVYVRKGMAAQRALSYSEIDSEYILFLDDDVEMPPDGVATLFQELETYGGDVIAPATFHNHDATFRQKLIRTLTGREVCRPWGHRWAFKVLPTAGFSYNNRPRRPVYRSETNAGPCFLCRKRDFLAIRYEDELWLDEVPYCIPDDMVMFYKMHLHGLRMLTSFDSGIVHADAGSTLRQSDEREARLIYSEYRNKLIFWYKFIYKPVRNPFSRFWAVLAIAYAYGLQALKYALRGGDRYDAFRRGVREGWQYVARLRQTANA